MNRRLALLGVLAAAALTGCGGKYSSPKATFDTLHDAATAGDKAAINACISDEAHRQIAEFKRLFAESKVIQSLDAADLFARQAKTAAVEVGEEAIQGDRATLAVKLNGRDTPLAFVKEKGGWKLAVPPKLAALLEKAKKLPPAMNSTIIPFIEAAVQQYQKG